MALNTTRMNVERVYSGRRGCMCGCRGKYNKDNASVVTRIYNEVMANPNHIVDETGKCVFVVTDTRNLVVWFK